MTKKEYEKIAKACDKCPNTGCTHRIDMRLSAMKTCHDTGKASAIMDIRAKIRARRQ